MKKRKKYFLIGMAVICLFFSGVLLWHIYALLNAKYVVRVYFPELFHVTHEYYAINEKRAVKVPEYLAKQFCGDGIVTKGVYDDALGNYWIVSLEYAEDDSDFSSGNYVETSFGENYRVTYRSWTGSTRTAGEEERQLFRKMAEEFCSGNLEEWTAKAGGRTELGFFFVAEHQGEYLFYYSLHGRRDTLCLVTDTGEFSEIMTRPEGGYFHYYFWF